MVSDRIFLPLFILTLAVIVYSAFAFGPRPDNSKGPLDGDPLEGFVLEGDNLNIIGTGPGLTMEVIDDPVDGKFIRTASGQTPTQGIRSAGTFVAILPDLGQAWQGHTVYAAVTLRQSEENGSDDVMFRYYAVDRGNGKPVQCPVSKDWSACYLSHFVPTSDKPPNMSFIGIWPDTRGLSRFVDINRIEVQIDQPFTPADN